jgi:S1-C subfamily serine protease
MGRIDAWECPKCGHMVPKKVTVCRCGHQWTGNERTGMLGAEPGMSANAADIAASQPPPSRSPWPAVATVAMVLAGGALVMRSRPAPAPPTAAVPSDSTPAHETPVSAPAVQSVATWPTDPALWKDGASPTSAVGAPVAAVAASGGTTSLEDVVSAALPAIVLVQTTDARGTGFFVSSDTVVTNAHVVDGATYVTLRTASGDETPAMVTVRSNELDLAELHVSKVRPGQVTLALADSSHLRVGEEVVAIGSAMGLQNTVTRGIVSGLRRLGPVMLVQTDAAINHGNSGGPIVDHSGRVVAVATMKMAGDAQSIGFGVAAEHVRALLDGRASLSASAPRPVDVLNSGTADTDSDRDDAVAGYERLIADAAKKVESIDRSWADLRAQCMSGPAPRARGDREWFVIWEGFDENRVSPGCSSYYTDLANAARGFEHQMTDAADAARRAGVYPGEARDIRHRYRLDSPDW